MPGFTVAVLVQNQFGVLNRVTSMFRRRRFNIKCLTVSETEKPDYSRITVSSGGGEAEKKQLIDQLYKLPVVISVQELHEEDSVSCELLLIKIQNEPSTRRDITDAAAAYGAQTVDYTRDSIILRLTGSSGRIDAFIDLMRDFTILEICRTGLVSLERGSKTIAASDR